MDGSLGRTGRAVAEVGAALCWLVLAADPGWAHERREVGDLIFVVGFGEEPAYAGQPNSVQLLLSDRQEDPVVDLGDDLRVEALFGEERLELPLEPRFVVGAFGTPGDYRAYFVPTRPGRYSFRFSGTIDGQEVDETFTSGPETFDDVQDPQAQMFPVQDPTLGQLSERLEREVARLSDEASGLDPLVLAALVIAVVALALAGLGFRRKG